MEEQGERRVGGRPTRRAPGGYIFYRPDGYMSVVTKPMIVQGMERTAELVWERVGSG